MEVLSLKELDVHSIQSGIDRTTEDINKIYEQIGNVQKAVRDFHLLEDAMGGDGLETIRAFYRDCHEPLLILLHQSMIDYESALKDIVKDMNSLEPSDEGYISQSFLKNEVLRSLDDVKSTAYFHTEEANKVINTVSDLVSIPAIDESNLLDEVQRGRRRIDDLIGNLHELDATQTNILSPIKDQLQTMENYISELESLFARRNFSITDYSLSKMREFDSFRAVTDSVYGEEGIIGLIFNKLRNGDPITDIERENLYTYYQNEVLDDDKRAEIRRVASFIDEEDIHQLKDFLNGKVLTSRESLMREIISLEAFLFTPNAASFDIDYIDTDSRQKLSAYLTMLKDYHTAIVSDDIYEMEVHTLEYEDQPNGVNEHVLKTSLELKAKIDDPDPDAFFDMSRALGGSYFYDAELTYFTTTDAAGFHDYLETQKLIDKEATFTRDFIISKFIKTVAVKASKRAAPVVDGYLSISEHQAELNELRETITIQEAIQPSKFINMELSITDSTMSTVNAKDTKGNENQRSSNLQVKLYPMQSTFEAFDRWKEVHSYNQNIPYPQEAIQAQDWNEINKNIVKIDFGTDLYNYIFKDSEIYKDDIKVTSEELANEYGK